MINDLRHKVRWLFMPGLDLFTRRRVRLCRFWMHGPRNILDAGFGNGWFSYLAYRSGAAVVALSNNMDDVAKASYFYNIWRKIPPDKLCFKHLNLNNLDTLKGEFDEIICYETLEHVKDDVKLCKEFWRHLRKGGYLHLCSPYALHPRWARSIPADQENGDHIRKGYTLDLYKSFLEPIGFNIVQIEGMGGPLLTETSNVIQRIKNTAGNIFSILPVVLSIPFIWIDRADIKCPYSLYVKAVKA